MGARNAWGNKSDSGSVKPMREGRAERPDIQLDDLLDARFDQEGRLSQIGHGSRQRITTRLDPRPPDLGAEELERAVQKLAQGLEVIERQSRAARQAEAEKPGEAPGEPERGREFVTYSLDRLEARLEALSKRLQQRAGGAVPPADAAGRNEGEEGSLPPPAERAAETGRREIPFVAGWGDPTFAVDPEGDPEAEPPRAAPAKSAATEWAPGRAEATEMRRLMEQAEERRRAETAEVRWLVEQTEEKRRAESAEAKRLIDEAEERRRTESAAAARREAEATAQMTRQFRHLEQRLESLQADLDENQIEPVRGDLLELLNEIHDLGRDGRSMADALAQAHARLDEVDVKVNAARNMAGNRLGDIQDRLVGLTERLDQLDLEIPGFDAVRENQTAILERFDRMEGLVQHLAAADELIESVEAVKRQLQTVAGQREAARIEEQILGLADRIDALPADIGASAAVQRLDNRLQAMASDFAESRHQRASMASDMDHRLSELAALLREVGETGRAPDLSGLDQRLSDIGERLDEDRRLSGESQVRLERRIAELAGAIEEQEGAVAAEVVAGLTGKISSLSSAIDAQDARGTRQHIDLLDRKLDLLAVQLAEQGERLSPPQLEPLETRLDVMQAQLEDLARRTRDSTSRLGPFTQTLQEVSDRLNALGPAGAPAVLLQRLTSIEERIAGLAARPLDTRALQTQFEAVISRLEVLKGRSIDPARLNDLFDRVDIAIRTLPEDRFDQLEQRLEQAIVPAERFDRLERRISESAAEISDDRVARLERKLEEFGAAYAAGGEALTPDDLAELRTDIVALRRELRSLPGLGEGESNLGDVLRTLSTRIARLPEDPLATAADLDAQIERLAEVLDDPRHSRLALAHIETSLRAIEEHLEETRRAVAYRMPYEGEGEPADGEIQAVAGLARSLSDDVSTLKNVAESSERKTKDALEAVQGTLEAVVKRMAFLERDADAAGSAERERPRDSARHAPPPATADRTADKGEFGKAAAIPEPSIAGPEPRDAGPGGLFGRFTSSQLLRRATGGRTESFSPEPEEGYEAADTPLEPGTDAPLISALSGAPSSDTARMSGAYSRAGPGSPAESRDRSTGRQAGRSAFEPAPEDDFLTAARRAARAAADEVGGDRDSIELRGTSATESSPGLAGGRRRLLVAAVLAVAVAFAAFQVIRNDLIPGIPEMAGLSGTDRAAGPLAEEPSALDAAGSETVAVVESAPPPPISTPAAPEPTAALPPDAPTAAIPADAGEADIATETRAEPADIGAAEETGESEIGPLIASRPEPEAERPAETEVAALEPEPNPAPTMNATPFVPPATALPAAIGPQRLRDAALAGDPVAAFEVAARYAEGRSVPQDMAAAVAWYEQAAEAGLAPAQYRLGSIYEKGLGGVRDVGAAQEWYTRATEAGNVKAMHNLAVLYAEGAAGEPDLERAAELFRQAAEHGVRDSQFNLAILHARGLGVPQDLIEAYKWFAVAAGSGDEESLRRRDIIAAALAEPDRAKAEAAAAAFEPIPLVAEANEMLLPEGGWGDDATGVEIRSDNELVALVQKLLAEQGFDPGPADGLLGRQTIEAITAFQQNAGLPRTGQIDNLLVSALQGPST